MKKIEDISIVHLDNDYDTYLQYDGTHYMSSGLNKNNERFIKRFVDCENSIEIFKYGCINENEFQSWKSELESSDYYKHMDKLDIIMDNGSKFYIELNKYKLGVYEVYECTQEEFLEVDSIDEQEFLTFIK